MKTALNVNDINLLRAQNEGLKKQNIDLQKENQQLLKQKNNMMKKNIILYTTLQEIKAIAEEIADTENWLNCGYNASRAKKILDLIKEQTNEK